jgi:hypothetical protein
MCTSIVGYCQLSLNCALLNLLNLISLSLPILVDDSVGDTRAYNRENLLQSPHNRLLRELHIRLYLIVYHTSSIHTITVQLPHPLRLQVKNPLRLPGVSLWYRRSSSNDISYLRYTHVVFIHAST